MGSHLDRRSLLRAAGGIGAAVTLGGLGSLAAGSAAPAAPAGFPDYAYLGQPLDMANLRYNPTGELIFPCIRGVYDKITGAIGRYYLYYAPHDAPGGICMAYGDSLAGPFTEYPANPIISRTWSPYYSVTHVSSPHVIWNPDNAQFYLYFHGENTTTRMAWSTDGIHYTYHGVVLHTGVIPNSTETSYARVFEHQVPGLGNRYVMVFMANQSGTRRIFWGWSSTGKIWQFDPEPLIWPSADGEDHIGAPYVLKRNNTCYVVYHGNSGRMYLTEVGNSFDHATHLGVFHYPMAGPPDNGRSAAPSFGTDGGVSYMFYEAGQRGATRIALARAV
jgi:hypothetical protein